MPWHGSTTTMMQHMMRKHVGVISEEGASSKTENRLLSLFPKRKKHQLVLGGIPVYTKYQYLLFLRYEFLIYYCVCSVHNA